MNDGIEVVRRLAAITTKGLLLLQTSRNIQFYGQLQRQDSNCSQFCFSGEWVLKERLVAHLIVEGREGHPTPKRNNLPNAAFNIPLDSLMGRIRLPLLKNYIKLR